MRLFSIAPVLAYVKLGMSISFVNPPSAPQGGASASDPSLNPVYPIGSSLNIQWTAAPAGNFTSLVIYQSRPNDQFVYLDQNVQGVTTFNWPVATLKNISETPIFFFEIFIEGQTAPAATSHSFNLTSKDTTNSAPSSVASTSASSTSTGTSSTSSSNPTSSNIPSISATTSSTPSAAPSSGLSTSAKAGLGIGIPVAVILSFAAGWFVFGRNRKPKEGNAPVMPAETSMQPDFYNSQGMRHQLDGESTAVHSAYGEATAKHNSSVNPPQVYEL